MMRSEKRAIDKPEYCRKAAFRQQTGARIPADIRCRFSNLTKVRFAVRYMDRFQQVLVNPTWAQIVERDPLIEFSHYLSGRINVLCSFADEIIENLDKGFSGQCVDGGRVERAESLMWFWLLGAYEVV